jgi:hypothetical protein
MIKDAIKPYLHKPAFQSLQIELDTYLVGRSWVEDFFDEVLKLAAQKKLGKVKSFEGRIWRDEKIEME